MEHTQRLRAIVLTAATAIAALSIGTTSSFASEITGKLLFENNSDIYVTNPNGSEQPEKIDVDNPSDWPTFQPVRSPNEEKIAFVRYDQDQPNESGLQVLDLATNTVTPFLKPQDSNLGIEGITWSPDGLQLAYGDITKFDGTGSPQCQIWVVNADGSGNRKLTDSGCYPDWSPDGSKIVYVNGTDCTLCVASAIDGHLLLKLIPKTMTRASAPDWSPDGTQIAYTLDVLPNLSKDRLELRIKNANGSGSLFGSRIGATFVGDKLPFDLLDPDWSSDGSRIAFAAVVRDTRNWYSFIASFKVAGSTSSHLEEYQIVTQTTPVDEQINPDW